MVFNAKQIAELINGEIEGNAEAKVDSFAKIEEGRDGAISFLSNPKYTHYIYDTKSSIVIINKDVVLEHPVSTTLIRVDNAYECVARLLQMYESMKPKKTGIHPLSFISPKAKVGDCYVGAFVYIGDGATVGDGCQIYPGCLYDGCKIGNRVTIHSGSVIGADGFGFAPSEKGYDKIPQIGIVTIEDDVEIGANTCIDRSTMGSTYIRKGAKLDNLIQIAHNAEVGANTVMAAQCGVAGSTKLGDWCMFGGQVGMAGHLHITNHTTVGAQAGITNSITKEGQTIIGSPAIDAKSYMKSYAIFRRLPDMYSQINELKKEIELLKGKYNS